MAVGMVYGHYTGMTNVDFMFFCLIGFTIGYAIGMVALKVIIAAVAAIYVLFAEHPERFEETHDVLYYELLHSWQEMYPSSAQRVHSTLSPSSSTTSNQGNGSEISKAMGKYFSMFATFMGSNIPPSSQDGYKPVQATEEEPKSSDVWSYKSISSLVQEQINKIGPKASSSNAEYMVSQSGSSEELGFSL